MRSIKLGLLLLSLLLLGPNSALASPMIMGTAADTTIDPQNTAALALSD